MNHKRELEKELKILQEKTKAVINQFQICSEIILDRLSDIDKVQDYLIAKIKKD